MKEDVPNYYTHLKFGAVVLGALPTALAGLLSEEREAFELGCLGPDPLFFYRPLGTGAVRREGHAMHKVSALPAVKRLRRAVEENVPMVRGYAAGFFCHLALDSACHSYVDARAAEGDITHLAIEAEFDRTLMVEDGWPLNDRHAHMPEICNPAVWTAAARAYEHVTPRQMEGAFRAMARDTAMLARACARPRGRLIDLVSWLIPPARGIRGIALRAVPDPACAACGQILRMLMNAAVRPTAREIAGFFEDIAQERVLSEWFDRDFKGNIFGSPPEKVLTKKKRRAIL